MNPARSGVRVQLLSELRSLVALAESIWFVRSVCCCPNYRRAASGSANCSIAVWGSPGGGFLGALSGGAGTFKALTQAWAPE